MRSRKKSRRASHDGLTEGLLAGDALQMTERKYQPKSFFNNDEDELKSESAASMTPAETFESVGYSWDFVIVLPVLTPDSDFKPELEASEIVQLLHDGGLQTYLFKSVQEDEIICKVRASLERLKTHAEMIGYKMQYDEEEVRQLVEWGIPNSNGIGHIVKGVNIKHDKSITELHPYEFIHGPFKSDHMGLFSKAEHLDHPFSAQHRLKLLMSIIVLRGEGCCGLNLPALKKNGSVLAFYPLHDEASVKLLTDDWLHWSVGPWDQPIDDIRDYFGEKVGMYFEFLGNYTSWLLPLCVVGVCVTIDIIVESAVYGSYTKAIGQGYTVPAFCVFVAFWSQLFLEYWKRAEATKAMEWGMSDFEELELERPAFEGEDRVSHIDGTRIKYFPANERHRRSQFSMMIVSGMILFVIACVAVIFYVKFAMVVQSDNKTANDLGGTLASALNAIQIQVLNTMYSELAEWLTNRENHRTETQYEDALISKLFAFQFVNSYASFFYIAFIKEGAGDPCAGSCMSELSYALAIIFCTRLFIGNAQEVFVPVAMSWYKKRLESQGVEGETEIEKERRLHAAANMSKAESQYTLEEYDAMMGAIDDYAELAIQYGYVTLFVAAFPIAPLLAFGSNIVEIRTDGWKLLHAYRRPIPHGAQDIGTWLSILQLTSIISVGTNAGIICFTMDIFDVTPQGKLWIFIGFQYFVFALMAIFAYIVDDQPEEVVIQLSRQDFIVDKVRQIMAQIPDDDEVAADHSITKPMLIHDCDDEAQRAADSTPRYNDYNDYA